MFSFFKSKMVEEKFALKGRDEAIKINPIHYVNGYSMLAPFPENCEVIYFGMGCFWGAERKFWQAENIYVTAVGYGGGFTKNPTYDEVCTGRTGHNELVMVVFEKGKIEEMLKTFFENHDPTQGMRQGNDIGTQYRSGIYPTNDQQKEAAQKALEAYQETLKRYGFGEITTEIKDNISFYYAEEYHQQYLAKNPNGYCGLGGTGIACPIGIL